MKKLSKKGDLRHVINIPKAESVKAEPGNIFGTQPVGLSDEPEQADDAADMDPTAEPAALSATARFLKKLRLPLFIRFWGRS